MKSNNIYILYAYDEFNDDFNYIMEYNDIKELQQKNDIKLSNPKSIYYYIQDKIKDNNKLLNDKYLVIKEKAII